MQKKTMIWITITAVLTGVTGFFVYDLIKKSKENKTASDQFLEDEILDISDSSSITNPVDNLISSASFPLKLGSKGFEVSNLQKWLNNKGYASPKLLEDGVFGALTQKAVKNMQENPTEKAIFDFNNSTAWLNEFLPERISFDFYNKFIK